MRYPSNTKSSCSPRSKWVAGYNLHRQTVEKTHTWLARAAFHAHVYVVYSEEAGRKPHNAKRKVKYWLFEIFQHIPALHQLQCWGVHSERNWLAPVLYTTVWVNGHSIPWLITAYYIWPNCAHGGQSHDYSNEMTSWYVLHNMIMEFMWDCQCYRLLHLVLCVCSKLI